MPDSATTGEDTTPKMELKQAPSGKKQVESIRAWIRPPTPKNPQFVSCVRIDGGTPSRRNTGTNVRGAALAFNLLHAREVINGTLPPGVPVKDDTPPSAEQIALL